MTTSVVGAVVPATDFNVPINVCDTNCAGSWKIVTAVAVSVLVGNEYEPLVESTLSPIFTSAGESVSVPFVIDVPLRATEMMPSSLVASVSELADGFTAVTMPEKVDALLSSERSWSEDADMSSVSELALRRPSRLIK